MTNFQKVDNKNHCGKCNIYYEKVIIYFLYYRKISNSKKKTQKDQSKFVFQNV